MACNHNTRDPFGTLPLELSQRITQYLDLYQIFQARRVSKRWNAVLSSSYIVESMVLRPWYNGKESPLRIPESLSEKAVISLKAEHVDAFRNGRACSVSVSNTEKWTKEACYENVVYSRGVLAWLTTDEKNIRLKCLASGSSETLASPDGNGIIRMVLDGCLLVATTWTDTCFVWKLIDGVRTLKLLGPIPFGLEPFVLGIIVSDSRLAILYEEERTDKIRLTTVDISNETTHDFELRVKTLPSDFDTDFKILNTPGGKSVVYFERVLDSPSYVYFTRVSPDGTVESQGHIKHPDIEDYTCHNEETQLSLQLDESVTVWSYLRHLPSPLSEEPDSWLLLRVCYVQDHLEVKEQTIKYIGKTLPGALIELFEWKDIVYLGNHLDEQGKLEVIDLSESTWKPTRMSVRLTSLPLTQFRPWVLLGDETFLISVQGESCMVWCFDRHLTQAIPFEDEGQCN